MPELPLFKAKLPIAAGQLVLASAPHASAPDRNLVLLVDDHDLVRETTAETLLELGYRVVEAGSGEEAVRLLEEGLEVDLMITDLVMPGLGGAELAALARARRPGLPVLLVSGHPDPEGVPADLPCLAKPYRRAVLADRVAALLPLARPRLADAVA